MGRWSQARKRGGGSMLLKYAVTTADWSLDNVGGHVVSANDISEPADVENWQARYRTPAGSGDWTITPVDIITNGLINTVFASGAVVEAQVRWLSAAEAVLSDWSPSQTVVA